MLIHILASDGTYGNIMLLVLRGGKIEKADAEGIPIQPAWPSKHERQRRELQVVEASPRSAKHSHFKTLPHSIPTAL